MKDIILPCHVAGMDEPLLLSISASVENVQIAYAIQDSPNLPLVPITQRSEYFLFNILIYLYLAVSGHIIDFTMGQTNIAFERSEINGLVLGISMNLK